MALQVKHVGEFGEHAIAKNAGIRKGDIVVAFDGLDQGMSETQLIAHAVQRKRPGDEVNVTVLRDSVRTTHKISLR